MDAGKTGRQDRKRKKNSGITMVELVITVSLMGIVGVVVMGFLAMGVGQLNTMQALDDHAAKESRTQIALLLIVQEGRRGAFNTFAVVGAVPHYPWEMFFEGRRYRAFAQEANGDFTPVLDFYSPGSARIFFIRYAGFAPSAATGAFSSQDFLPPEAFMLRPYDEYIITLDCGEEPQHVTVQVTARSHPGCTEPWIRESRVAVNRIPEAEPTPEPTPTPDPTPNPTPEPTPTPIGPCNFAPGQFFPVGFQCLYLGQVFQVSMRTGWNHYQDGVPGFIFDGNPNWRPSLMTHPCGGWSNLWIWMGTDGNTCMCDMVFQGHMCP